MRTFIFCALLTASLQVVAADVALLPAGSTDQVPTRVVSRPMPTMPSEHKPVQFSWALDPTNELREPEPFVVESREYWQTVDAAELRRGVAISTTAPGALIRVSPAKGAAAVDPSSVRVLSAGRRVGLELRSGAAQLQAAGMPVSDGVAAVKLGRGAAAGRYAVQVPQARGQYVVHVYEPESSVRLYAALGRDRVLAGGGSNISVTMGDGGRVLRGLQATGLLVAPSGKSWPIALHAGKDGVLRGKVPVPTQTGDTPGLWEVQVFAGNGRAQRDARTAMAVAQPTARLAGGVAFDAARLQFRLPVEVGSPGRYEVRGTLYATGRNGLLQPVAIAHSADWLEPGKLGRGNSQLLLAFKRGELPTGYGAPFELRDLELNDQSRMAPIERRARAVRVTR